MAGSAFVLFSRQRYMYIGVMAAGVWHGGWLAGVLHASFWISGLNTVGRS